MLIDTHAAVRELEAAGLETTQAEAIVNTIAQADERIATKSDIAALRAEVKRLDERIDSLRSEMRWMLGFLAALLLAMAGRLFGIV